MDARREVSLLALGAILGAIITIITDAVRAKDPGVVTLTASIVLLCALALVALRLLGPLSLILAPAKGYKLEGAWQGKFSYEKNGTLVSVSESLDIRQRGRYVRGVSRSTAIEGDFPLASTTSCFTAALDSEGILDGTWRSTLPAQRFHGALQAKIRRDGSRIVGTWIGLDEYSINRGEFLWSRAG